MTVRHIRCFSECINCVLTQCVEYYNFEEARFIQILTARLDVWSYAIKVNVITVCYFSKYTNLVLVCAVQ